MFLACTKQHNILIKLSTECQLKPVFEQVIAFQNNFNTAHTLPSSGDTTKNISMGREKFKSEPQVDINWNTPLWILKHVREIDWCILVDYSGLWWSINVNRKSDNGFPGAKISVQILSLGIGDHKSEVRKVRLYLHLEGQIIFNICFPAWQLSNIKTEMIILNQPVHWEDIL